LLTFNYDPLLDDAVERSLRVDLSRIEYFVTGRPDLVYTKLHGSADWRRVVAGKPRRSGTIGATALIGAADDLKFTPEFIIAGVDARKKRPRSEDFTIRSGEYPNVTERVTFPALALPLRSKTTFACPLSHIEAVRRALGETTKLLVVGWRAQEQHFLAEWERTGSKKIRADIVCGSAGGAEAVAQRLRAAGIDGDLRTFGLGFTDYVRSNALRALLSA
jgi:hypothetical protein